MAHCAPLTNPLEVTRKKRHFPNSSPSLSHKRYRPSTALNSPWELGWKQHPAFIGKVMLNQLIQTDVFMICRSTAWKPVSLTCWINKNLFSSNKIWWGDNFASIQHKGLSHVQGRCTLRANPLKVWRGSSAHGGQDDSGRYGWSGPPLGTGLHVPTKQSKVLFVHTKIV